MASMMICLCEEIKLSNGQGPWNKQNIRGAVYQTNVWFRCGLQVPCVIKWIPTEATFQTKHEFAYHVPNLATGFAVCDVLQWYCHKNELRFVATPISLAANGIFCYSSRKKIMGGERWRRLFVDVIWLEKRLTGRFKIIRAYYKYMYFKLLCFFNVFLFEKIK